MNAGCAGKTVRSLENACHTRVLYRSVHDEALYKLTFTLPFPQICAKVSKNALSHGGEESLQKILDPDADDI